MCVSQKPWSGVAMSALRRRQLPGNQSLQSSMVPSSTLVQRVNVVCLLCCAATGHQARLPPWNVVQHLALFTCLSKFGDAQVARGEMNLKLVCSSVWYIECPTLVRSAELRCRRQVLVSDCNVWQSRHCNLELGARNKIHHFIGVWRMKSSYSFNSEHGNYLYRPTCNFWQEHVYGTCLALGAGR